MIWMEALLASLRASMESREAPEAEREHITATSVERNRIVLQGSLDQADAARRMGRESPYLQASDNIDMPQ